MTFHGYRKEVALSMNSRKYLIAAWVSLSIASFGPAIKAQDMDVDQADTIDFESFHKDKKEAVKVWKNDKKNETVKAYDQTAPAAATTAPATTSSTPVPAAAAAPAVSATQPAQAASGPKGQRFEIRERYTLTRSTKTPYSAFYVIEPLYKQAAQLCPRGWRKLTERSEPIEQDFYLYYELECL
jgi:hypothetical protein